MLAVSMLKVPIRRVCCYLGAQSCMHALCKVFGNMLQALLVVLPAYDVPAAQG